MTIQQTSFCSFRLKFKNSDVVINPTSKLKEEDIFIYTKKDSSYLKYPEEGVTLLSMDAAGEYETKDIFILGEKVKGSDDIVYTVNADDVNVGMISFIKDIASVPVDHFEESDVILIGAGGGDLFFSLNDANNLIQKLSPKICIVFGFREQADKSVKEDLATIDDFKKEIEGAILADKSFKILPEDLERIENTVVYYFEV